MDQSNVKTIVWIKSLLKVCTNFQILSTKSVSVFSVNNIKVEDPVPLMLNYLQFCYFKVNKLLEAANAAKSQELLTPNDENAKKNVQYYMGKVLESGHKDFQGIVPYHIWMLKLKRMPDCMRYIDQKIMNDKSSLSRRYCPVSI